MTSIVLLIIVIVIVLGTFLYFFLLEDKKTVQDILQRFKRHKKEATQTASKIDTVVFER
ncbi:hypothetical protein KKH82_08630 [Patescibacteria group bacterium]|nr:hypothetical protein [Patescibacteria group bacterium]